MAEPLSARVTQNSGETPVAEPLIAPITVDYGGATPGEGDHLAIPVGLWSDMCFLAGAASIHMPTSTIVKRANEAIAQAFPVIRFGGTGRG